MPVVVLILTVIGGMIWWWIRNNPRDAIDIAVDTATTIKNAPRRFAFKKQANRHPVDTIEETEIAIAALVQAMIQLEALPTQESQKQAGNALRNQYNLTLPELEELQTLGNWFVGQCQSAHATISRVSKRLHKIGGDVAYNDLIAVLGEALPDGPITDAQHDALRDIKVAFKK